MMKFASDHELPSFNLIKIKLIQSLSEQKSRLIKDLFVLCLCAMADDYLKLSSSAIHVCCCEKFNRFCEDYYQYSPLLVKKYRRFYSTRLRPANSKATNKEKRHVMKKTTAETQAPPDRTYLSSKASKASSFKPPDYTDMDMKTIKIKKGSTVITGKVINMTLVQSWGLMHKLDNVQSLKKVLSSTRF